MHYSVVGRLPGQFVVSVADIVEMVVVGVVRRGDHVVVAAVVGVDTAVAVVVVARVDHIDFERCRDAPVRGVKFEIGVVEEVETMVEILGMNHAVGIVVVVDVGSVVCFVDDCDVRVADLPV